MKSNILFTVQDLKLIAKVKDLGIRSFVYPLSFFCVGVKQTYSISQMQEKQSYIFVNRILDTKSVDELVCILEDLPSNIKGIIFEDIGLIEALKNLKIEKILFNSHFLTNYASVNKFLKYVDTVIISTDITKDEVKEIVQKASKKVSFLTFGLVSAMYSRRTLLKSHALHYEVPYVSQKLLVINNTEFLAMENEYGTVLYHYPYFDARILEKYDAKYYFYFPIGLNNDQVISLLHNDMQDIKTTSGFLEEKTIYKVKK